MSEAEIRKLQDSNPNLFKDVQSGRLPEANKDFVEVANKFPLPENQ